MHGQNHIKFITISFYGCHKISIFCIKQSRNSPGVAQRVPGGLGSQISMKFTTLTGPVWPRGFQEV